MTVVITNINRVLYVAPRDGMVVMIPDPDDKEKMIPDLPKVNFLRSFVEFSRRNLTRKGG